MKTADASEKGSGGSPADRPGFGTVRRGLSSLPTLVLLNCLLLGALWVRFGELGPHWLALEAVVIVAVFSLLPRGRTSRALAGITALLVSGVSLLSFADTAMRQSLARPLNLYLDLRLADSVVHLLQGSLGPVRGALAVAAGVIAALACIALMAWQLDRLALPEGHSGLRPRAAPALLLGAALVAVPVRWQHPTGVVMALPAVQVITEQSTQIVRMREERRLFAVELASPLPSPASAAGLYQGLGARDVVLAFIESYGSTVLDDPRYAPVVRPRLDNMAKALDQAGVHVVTGRLEAPSQGGMSWLGHGSVLSGLWLDNQLRYDLMLASDRTTLVDDFRAAGYHTAALMPAITLAWPEGVRFGYDEIRDHARIDYAGPPLNWVTMPDQFTWSYLEQTMRHRKDGQPVFAELGLISSHAPWTPILEVIEDWGTIGDGRIFERWRDAGERPEDLWRDSDRVREHYARSVSYALETLSSWASRFIDDGVVVIALGDHQPAPLITGDDAPRTVPIHVMATDPELLFPFEQWGFAKGVFPPEAGTAADAPEVRRMSEFRGWFVETFGRRGRDDERADGDA